MFILPKYAFVRNPKAATVFLKKKIKNLFNSEGNFFILNIEETQKPKFYLCFTKFVFCLTQT